MADLKVINVETVSNPDMLVDVLFAMSTELRKYQSQVNELVTDHSLFVQTQDSFLSGMVTLNSAMSRTFEVMGASKAGAAGGSVVDDASCTLGSTFDSEITAGPAQLTASKLVSHFIDQSTYSNR